MVELDEIPHALEYDNPGRPAYKEKSLKIRQSLSYRKWMSQVKKAQWENDSALRDRVLGGISALWQNNGEHRRKIRERGVFRVIDSAQQAYVKLSVLSDLGFSNYDLGKYSDSGMIVYSKYDMSSGNLTKVDTRENLNQRLYRGKKTYDKVIVDNQPLVSKMVSDYSGIYQPVNFLEESIQESLMVATAKYDYKANYLFDDFFNGLVKLDIQGLALNGLLKRNEPIWRDLWKVAYDKLILVDLVSQGFLTDQELDILMEYFEDHKGKIPEPNLMDRFSAGLAHLNY